MKSLLFTLPLALAACGGSTDYVSEHTNADGSITRCETNVSWEGTFAKSNCSDIHQSAPNTTGTAIAPGPR